VVGWKKRSCLFGRCGLIGASEVNTKSGSKQNTVRTHKQQHDSSRSVTRQQLERRRKSAGVDERSRGLIGFALARVLLSISWECKGGEPRRGCFANVGHGMAMASTGGGRFGLRISFLLGWIQPSTRLIEWPQPRSHAQQTQQRTPRRAATTSNPDDLDLDLTVQPYACTDTHRKRISSHAARSHELQHRRRARARQEPGRPRPEAVRGPLGLTGGRFHALAPPSNKHVPLPIFGAAWTLVQTADDARKTNTQPNQPTKPTHQHTAAWPRPASSSWAGTGSAMAPCPRST